MKSFKKLTADLSGLLIALFLLLSVVTCDAQVQIPDSVARFFLERHEIAKYLEKENEVIKQGLATLEKTIKGKDFVIETYKKDNEIYGDMILLEREKGELCNSRIEDLERDLRKQRRKTKIIAIGGIVLTIAALLL